MKIKDNKKYIKKTKTEQLLTLQAMNQNHELKVLDLTSRRKTVRTIKSALKFRFPNRGGSTNSRLDEWSRTLAIISHAQSTRSLDDAESFTFRAMLRLSSHVSQDYKRHDIRGKDAPCFVKLAWKPPRETTGACAERKLLSTGIESLLRRGKTPCLPFAIHQLKLPTNDVLKGWEVYRDLLKQSGAQLKDRGKFAHLLMMETCGDMTLIQYLQTYSGERCDMLQMYLMVCHTLQVLAEAGISHNDLHLANIVVKTIPVTVVSFGGRVFRTSVVPVIIDWDFGCSRQVYNQSLELYSHVGIFNTRKSSIGKEPGSWELYHNPLYDLFGVTKALIALSDRTTGTLKPLVMSHDDMRTLVGGLKELFQPVVAKHPWLFSHSFIDEDGKRVSTVQQTVYITDKETCEPRARWPPNVFELTPSFEKIQDKIHALIESLEGRVDEDAQFKF